MKVMAMRGWQLVFSRSCGENRREVRDHVYLRNQSLIKKWIDFLFERGMHWLMYIREINTGWKNCMNFLYSGWKHHRLCLLEKPKLNEKKMRQLYFFRKMHGLMLHFLIGLFPAEWATSLNPFIGKTHSSRRNKSKLKKRKAAYKDSLIHQ
jgi:hypothetical protein